jgi:hypothetical protein
MMSVHLVNIATQWISVKLIVVLTFVGPLCYLRQHVKIRRVQMHLIAPVLLDKVVLKSLIVSKTKPRSVAKHMVKHRDVIRTAQNAPEELTLNALLEHFVFRLILVTPKHINVERILRLHQTV